MNTWLRLLLIFMIISTTHAKIYNILGCNVKDETIIECDGTKTPITQEHELILNRYMDDLASYYRQQYPPTDVQSDDPPKDKPNYPQMCKVCDSN